MRFVGVNNVAPTRCRCAQPPVCIRTHKNDHERTLQSMYSMSEFGGLWTHEKTQRALFNELGLGSTTLLQVAFLGESDPNFSWEKFLLGQQNVQNTKKTKYKNTLILTRKKSQFFLVPLLTPGGSNSFH